MVRINHQIQFPGLGPFQSRRGAKPATTQSIKATHSAENGLQIQNGGVRYTINPLGGRITSVLWNGFELLLQDQRPSQEIPTIGSTEPRCGEIVSPHGDKTLRAPQNLTEGGFPLLNWYWRQWTVVAQFPKGDLTVRMASPICQDTGLRAQSILRLSKEHPHTWALTHLIANKGNTPQEATIWNIEATRPGKIIMPWGRGGIQAFTGFGESEKNIGKLVKRYGEYGVIDHTLPGGGMTKYGSISSQQMGPMIVGIFKDGKKTYAYLKRFQGVSIPNGEYGANGFSQETYSHGDYSELELAAPSKILQPDEIITATEWRTLIEIPSAPRSEVDVQMLVRALCLLEAKASSSLTN
jgi:hypothetical protein